MDIQNKLVYFLPSLLISFPPIKNLPFPSVKVSGNKLLFILINLKDKHTKTDKLLCFKLQEYLISENLSNKQKQLLFSLRTRSAPVKTNYRNRYKLNMFCSLCEDQTEEESEIHLLRCKSTVTEVGDIGDSKYEDIFSPNVYRQEKITNIFSKIFKMREKLLNQKRWIISF